MRWLPRQGIFTSTPIIEYDGSWSISSGIATKLRIPYTIERLAYKNPTATKRQIYIGTNCQHFFRDEGYTENKGATSIDAYSLTYDAATDIYSGEVMIELVYYAGDWSPPLIVPADETSTSIIQISAPSSYWEQGATCRIEFRKYPTEPDGMYGKNKDLPVN